MKPVMILSLLWASVALGVGFTGSYLVQREASRQEELAFVRDAQAVAMLVSHIDWREPWDADPAWDQIERRFGMEIVPALTAAPAISAGESMPLTVQWMRSPSGPDRLATQAVIIHALSTEDGNAPQAIELSLTREVRSNRVVRWWWLSWSAMAVSGGLLVASSLVVVRRQRLRLQEMLVPWVAAARTEQAHNGYLPHLDSEREFREPLAVIREAVNRIISELLGDRHRNELVLGNLQEGVLAIDHRSRILLVNSALRRMLVVGDEDCLYRPLVEVVRVPAVVEFAEHVLHRQTPREEVIELTRTGSSLRVLGHPLPLSGGERGALITLRDETLLRRIESVRRDFVSNASHELKTPLAAIRAYAETLQLGALDERPVAEQFVGNIIAQADRIHTLVQGMLQLSRVEAGTALNIDNFDAQTAAEPCIAAASAVSLAKGVELHTVMPDCPIEIRSDRDGFQTIMSNLLSNAVRYTPSGGRVEVSLTTDESWCILRIADTGIGIRPEDLERIFERFYRAEKDRSTATGGTGLGLSIVKHLTQALGGKVAAQSELDVGSCFEVRLPLAGR